MDAKIVASRKSPGSCADCFRKVEVGAGYAVTRAPGRRLRGSGFRKAPGSVRLRCMPCHALSAAAKRELETLIRKV